MSRLNLYTPTLDRTFFNLNGVSVTRTMFWLPVRTAEDRPIRISVRAEETDSRRHISQNVFMPVIAVDVRSENLVTCDVGIFTMLSRNFQEAAIVRSPVAFLGLLPEPRAPRWNDRFAHALTIHNSGFTRMTHRPILTVNREFTKVSSSYFDVIPEDVWEECLDVPDNTHSWTQMAKNIKEGRFTIDFPYDAALLDIESDTVPQALIEAYTAHVAER